MAFVYDAAFLASAAADGLRAREAALRAEHAVRGLDAFDEVELHPVLAAGFAASGFGVLREIPFPGEPEARRKRRDRARCDLVLTPRAGQKLEDPTAEVLAIDRAAGTLFESVAEALAPADDPDRVEAGECCWIEVKAVAQFAFVDGVPGPNRAYTTQLVQGPAKDLAKLAADERVLSGASLVVLFAADRATADHDLHELAHRLLDLGVPMGEPAWEVVAVDDRAGNAVAAACVIPARL
jgi:hypothetical protein